MRLELAAPLRWEPVPVNPTPQSTFELLEELDRLLLEERHALRSLDIDAVERFAEQKLVLDGKLRAAAERAEPRDTDRKLVLRVRANAQINQVLLVHARSCVHGLVKLFAGEQAPLSPAGHTRVAPRPIALNIRG